jgi:hypothetical protein
MNNFGIQELDIRCRVGPKVDELDVSEDVGDGVA